MKFTNNKKKKELEQRELRQEHRLYKMMIKIDPTQKKEVIGILKRKGIQMMKMVVIL
jgi:hypothetical protein